MSMRDYNHDGKIDKNDFVIEEMLNEDDIQDNHGNSRMHQMSS